MVLFWLSCWVFRSRSCPSAPRWLRSKIIVGICELRIFSQRKWSEGDPPNAISPRRTDFTQTRPFMLFVRHRDSVRLVTALMSVVPKRIFCRRSRPDASRYSHFRYRRALHRPIGGKAFENCVGGLAEALCDSKEIGSRTLERITSLRMRIAEWFAATPLDRCHQTMRLNVLL